MQRASAVSHPVAGMLLLTVAGCSASGYPLFAKFSPDGRRLVCEDARYSRVYAYEPQAGRKTVLVGSVACIDDDVRRFILVPKRLGDYYGPFPIPCSLVTMTDGGLVAEELPTFSPGFKATVILMSFAPEQNAILARALDNRFPKPRADMGRFFRLTLPTGDWRRVDSSESFPEFKWWMLGLPGGARQGRYFYAPSHDPADGVPEEEKWGIDVEWAARGFERILGGPDREYVLRIVDTDDLWTRTTITQSATGRKQVLIDKNDGLLDVFDVLGKVVLFPLAPFLPKI
jgi:hypothetical protein